MKKNLLMLLTLALMAWAVLPACTNTSEKDPALQAPVTTQTETPAAGAEAVQAAPADSTAAAQKEAGGEKAEKESKEKDDDDDDRK